MGWPGPMTHRQFLAWHAWLDGEWNRPSRSDYYTMANTTAVKQVLSSKPNSIKVEQQKLRFGDVGDPADKPKTPPMTKERAAELSKARWAGFFAKSPERSDWPAASAKGNTKR